MHSAQPSALGFSQVVVSPRFDGASWDSRFWDALSISLFFNSFTEINLLLRKLTYRKYVSLVWLVKSLCLLLKKNLSKQKPKKSCREIFGI